MLAPLAPWLVVVMPLWLSTPRGSGAVPEPSSATRSSSSAICAANDRAMMPSEDGSASSNSSTESWISRTIVRLVKVIRSRVRSAAVIDAPSVFHAGLPSVSSRGMARVWLVMGTVTAPAWNTRVWLRARSTTLDANGLGTRAPPVPTVASAKARSCSAPSQRAVASPRR
jgi:hypothetical protein